MTIRKQNLEEWFTQYQLTALQREHFFIPYDMEIDVTRLTEAYAAAGERAPLTAIVVKAAACVARERPEINRAVLSTLFGTRVVQFSEAHVNVPVMMEHEGAMHLSATVLRSADSLSIEQIIQALRSAQQRKLQDLPIGRHFIKNENTLRRRLELRIRHAAAYAVPQFYERFGGGISVSSLVRAAPAGVLSRIPSYGPTAVSLCPGVVRTDGRGRTVMFMSAGYDHYALPGVQVVSALERLGELLVHGDPALFGPRTREPSSLTTPFAPVGALTI